ncbi:PAAR domain-containing protein [Halomonas sp. ANAO-440]|uniref:PAAR domain-containing protein n=1 Tax=Halomonas sp. ANAO-440 TaxID=2861360 RepID=UPI001CAA4DF4|nr:PAAR domain-containing protein [Halomonas sp. ANAO-440]MBZ0329687.1 PAAR domain-containing protein [Halomonas sp. ANAO-440]
MDLAKIGDKIVCRCKGGPHSIVSGASSANADGVPIARVGDKSSCGAAITTGASWYSIEGSPAAIHGSATSCGGYVEAASTTITGSPTRAGTSAAGSIAHPRSLRMPGNQNDSFRTSFAENSPETEYEYVASETEVIMNQPAYLFVEGVGSNGGYIFRVHVTIRDNTLHISARGGAPAAQIPGGGKAILGMRAELIDGDQPMETAVLQNTGTNAWPDEPQYWPVGHASLPLPEPQPGKTLSLYLQGTFQYQTSAGSAAPMPPSTNKTITIQVVEKQHAP